MVGTARRTRNVALLEAPLYTVYRAFVEPDLVATWLAPDGMTAHVHEFDAREGGEVRISLRYPAGSSEAGKSGDGRDVYRARFIELEPYSRIVEAITFDSDDPRFAGEMRMTVSLVEARPGTRLTLDFDDIPPGIDVDANRLGTQQALEKLAALVDRRAC
ncbi:MAG: SRPBCC domain-containing protein [Dehalococcoidia bacterium]